MARLLLAPGWFATALLAALAGCSAGSVTTGGGGGGTDDGTSGVPAGIVALEDSAFLALNAERAIDGDVALVHDGPLRRVARAHSEDMQARAFFDHVNPDGDDPFDRLAAAGITYSRAGENIAWNFGAVDPVTTAVTGWMNSSGHRANILDGMFTRAGLGVATDGAGAYWFTQVFSTPTSGLVMRSWAVAVDRDGDGAGVGDGDGGSSWFASGSSR